MLAALNDQLQERKLAAQYVTMLMAVWNDQAQTITVANAGSVQPLWFTANAGGEAEVHTLKVEGFPLGLFPNVTYDETVLQTAPGDMLIFFSDGIVDALNPAGDMFGEDRLCTLFAHDMMAHRSAEAAVEAILQSVNQFQAGTDHFDDETVVVLRAL
jgi:sigma-B regulation protein RsbU (phosphoserine phosphatase)